MPSAANAATRRAVRWPRARDGAAWAIPMALVIDAVGTGLHLPLSMVYFLAVTDLSEGGVGLLLTAATACSLLLPLLVGRIVDRVGPRSVVIAGLSFQAAGFFLYLGWPVRCRCSSRRWSRRWGCGCTGRRSSR